MFYITSFILIILIYFKENCEKVITRDLDSSYASKASENQIEIATSQLKNLKFKRQSNPSYIPLRFEQSPKKEIISINEIMK